MRSAVVGGFCTVAESLLTQKIARRAMIATATSARGEPCGLPTGIETAGSRACRPIDNLRDACGGSRAGAAAGRAARAGCASQWQWWQWWQWCQQWQRLLRGRALRPDSRARAQVKRVRELEHAGLQVLSLLKPEAQHACARCARPQRWLASLACNAGGRGATLSLFHFVGN